LRKLLLVSEPEAAAIYTARYLRNQSGAYFLKVRAPDRESKNIKNLH
jgi:hypothetical protein